MEGRGVEVDRMAPLHVNVESFHHRRPCGKTVSNRRCRRSIEPIAASSRVFFSTPSSLSSAQTPPQLKRKENTETRRPSWKTRKEASSWDAKARTWLVGMERSFNRAPIASFASVISTFALKFHSILMTEEFDWSPRNAKRLRAGTRKLERDWLEWSDHSTGLLFPPSL